MPAICSSAACTDASAKWSPLLSQIGPPADYTAMSKAALEAVRTGFSQQAQITSLEETYRLALED